ncbi:MAG: AAA family ATPase, partial [Proteobacteria bacterium]|nr:AAA family ATPase [Pseudomonadota bacterium]
GNSIDFRNVVLIMTTNAGSAELAKPAIGFEREGRVGDDMEAVEKMFTPEFRNRLDAVIQFKSLPPDVVAKVVDKFVMELEVQLEDRNVTIELSGPARELLAKKGYDEKFGARPLARVIQEKIKKPLAEELLFGKLAKGGVVLVKVKKKKFVFEYPDPKDPKDPKPPVKRRKGKVPALIDR